MDQLLVTPNPFRCESLARLAGLPMATIRERESGAGLAELGELEVLARAFGLTLPALLEGEA